jgi:hypothetical protein
MSRRLLWDPSYSTSSFVVSSSSELRWLQWNDTHIKTLAVVSDLPMIKTLAWCPAKSNLFAAGLATGRTLLLRINPESELPINESQQMVVASVNARVSRAVNAIAFNHAQSNVCLASADDEVLN